MLDQITDTSIIISMIPVNSVFLLLTSLSRSLLTELEQSQIWPVEVQHIYKAIQANSSKFKESGIDPKKLATTCTLQERANYS